MSLVVPARALAGVAVSAVAVAALAVPGTAAASVTVDCTADNAPLLAAAESAVAEATATRLAANRPLGLLLQAERRETRAEIRAARETIRALRAEARDSDLGHEERDALLEALRLQAAELRHAHRMLESKRALLADVKAGRTEAKAALAAARAALVELRAALDACTPDEVEPTTTDPSEEGEDTDAERVAIP